MPGAREEYLKKSVEEKRKLYRCGINYVTLSDIPTWTEYFEENLTEKGNQKSSAAANELLNSKVSIFTGDITTLEIDVIVNAANNRCLGGGGVDGAIHRAAGSLLLDECKTLNGCKTGEAKLTGGYNLPAKYIIHTVGPQGYKREALESAYLSSLKLAAENNLRTIAFPCISTGVYGYPNDKAADEVTKLVRDYLEKEHDKFDRIIFCLFMDVDISLYEQNLSEKFPVVKQQQCRVVRSTVEPPKAKKPEEPVLKISPESKTKSSGDL